VDSEPHFDTKLKAIRDEKEGIFLQKSAVGCGRMTRENLGVFPGNMAYSDTASCSLALIPEA
jgi:hypothetical protein